MIKKSQKSRGFTLIEILVVIGLIAILAGIVLIAINPARQFAQARNAQRESNVNTILNAIGQNMADNKGLFGGGCTSIPTATSTIGTSAGYDLSCLVPTYIPTAIPMDPATGTPEATNYSIVASTSGRVTICAPEYNEASLNHPGMYCVTR